MAVLAAARGWFVFPCVPNGKDPREVRPGVGIKWGTVATNDPEQVARCRWRPGENYGIAAKPSGLVVVDLDRRKPGGDPFKKFPAWRGEPGIADGWDTLAALAERYSQDMVPWTHTVRTPSGGSHLYYLAPAGRTIPCRSPGPMIDIKAAGSEYGGYVVGPGSEIDGARYEVIDDQDPVPLPEWLADAIDAPQQQRSGVVPIGTTRSADRHGRLRGLVQLVLDGKPGDRNDPLFWAACRAGEMIRDGQLDEDTAMRVLVDAALESGLRGGEPEAIKCVWGGLRRGAAA